MLLHVDETNAQIINQSYEKSVQFNAYNWVYRSVLSQDPTIVLDLSSLSCAQSDPESFIKDSLERLSVIGIQYMTK